MAILGKIRSKGVLLLVVVGFALFAFIIGDFLTQGSTYFNKSRETVAEIVGEDVNINDYQAAIDQMVEVYKIETGQTDLSEDVMAQLRASVWENLVTEKLLFAEAEKLGLAVSKEELSEYVIGNKTHPLIMQRRTFAGENGQFSRPMLVQFLNSLDVTPENEEMRQQIAQAKSYWLFWERNVKMAVLQDKYNALIGKAVTANSLEAKTSYEAAKVTTDVNYVVQPYFAISDSTVSVSKNEIKDRYNKNKELYKQEANRTLSYVAFEIRPLKEDSVEAQEWMNKISEEFKTTEDVVGLVNSNSDVMYDGRNYSYNSLPLNLRDFAFTGKTGDVFGPLFENNTHTMARIMESGILKSDSVKLRHIYLTTADEAKADSIIGAINGGAVFADLAKKYSSVPQTAANGGEIGWIMEGMQGMDKEITDKAFAAVPNQVFTVKNAQGVQIMQVMEKTPARAKVKLAILERKVIPSSRSYGRIYNEAKQFAAELKSTEFASKAQEKGVSVRTASELFESTERIADIPQSRQVIRWAFESDKGDVSDVFDCNNQFVVATTTEVNAKGYRSLEKVSDQIKAELIREKKADVMIKNLTEQLKKTPSLEALAQALSTDVKVANAVNFANNQFGVAGFEPALIGKVSVLPANKLSAPLKGNAGVYVLLPVNPQVNQNPFNAKAQVMQLNMNFAYSLPYMILQDIRDNAEIEDNRLNFF
ncbi:MAG: SurA N-terminal domain-containing protein [Paludibacter sp.]|jgi:peptidyl-prolyl cis-trans isomerase D|nr:SurA N-terminal domain-containing protein [Paludibacter sp.]